MLSIYIMNNVKRELPVINALLRLRNIKRYSTASHCIHRTVTVPNQITWSRPLTTSVSLRNLGEKLKTDSIEQHTKTVSIDETSLRTLLNDCIWNNMEDFGLNTLLNQRKLNKAGAISLNCYHILMETYAKNGNFEKVSQIYGILLEDGIVPAPQTYVYLFECLAKLKSSDDVVPLIKKFIEDAARNNITLNDIFDKSVFVRDQRELILEIIHKVEIDFLPLYTLPNLHYSNKLVQSLETPPTKNPFIQSAFTSDELQSLAREQIEIESKGGVLVDDITVSFDEISPAFREFCSRKLNELYAAWHKDFCKAFKVRFDSLKNKTEAGENNIYMCLTLLRPEQYADISLDALKSFLQRSGGRLIAGINLYHALGQSVLQSREWELKKADGIIEKTTSLYDKYCEEISTDQSYGNYRQKWQRLEFVNRNNGPSFYKQYAEWSNVRCVQVGKFLYDILREEIKIDEHLFEKDGSKAPSYKPILSMFSAKRSLDFYHELNPTLLRLYRESERKTIYFTIDQIPMICPPIPITSVNSGNNLILNTPLLRSTDDTTQVENKLMQTPLTDLYTVFDNLNNASNVAFKINTHVLDILIELYNKRFDDTAPQKIINLQDKLRTTQEFISHKLSLANYLRNKSFWYAHNREPKGRIFALATILSYGHSDFNRAVVTFHKKRPLGKNGLDWLKLFCINLAKLKSHESMEDRIKYADEIMDDILDSADNPLSGRLWWLNSRKPFQTLACCVEIANAIRSPDPTKYLSSMPVHQDGSCNALQHYAGLSRDRTLAENVNLSFKEKPQDIYSAAVDLIEERRVEDAENDIGIAKLLEGYVTRKLLKIAIVGFMYGGGIERTRLSIETELCAIPEFPQRKVKTAAAYLETKFRNISPLLFKAAQDILLWLKQCAFYISEYKGKSLEWKTPLNIPLVLQHYGSVMPENKKRAFTNTRYFSKNVTAFAPNFILSLEATHMILTSLHCTTAGLTFLSEHDSFATHACTVDEMNKICREQFLLLYSEPILENLSAYFCEEHMQNLPMKKTSTINQTMKFESDDVHVLKKYPKTGDFDLREVLKSTYFFN